MSKTYSDIVIEDADAVSVSRGNCVSVGRDLGIMCYTADKHEELAAAHLEAARRIRLRAHLPVEEHSVPRVEDDIEMARRIQGGTV